MADTPTRLYLVKWRAFGNGHWPTREEVVRAYSAADAATQVEVARRGQMLSVREFGGKPMDEFDRIESVEPHTDE